MLIRKLLQNNNYFFTTVSSIYCFGFIYLDFYNNKNKDNLKNSK